MPKPLVKVAGRPILEHIMDHYSRHDLNNFTLCLGYGGDMIREHFVNYRIRHHDFSIRLGNGGLLQVDDPPEGPDWMITCAETGYEALTGARISRARKYLQGPYFLCTYGDGLTNVDIRELVAFHRSHGRIATVTAVRSPLSDSDSAGRFGQLIIDGDDRVVRFTEKPGQASRNGSGYINGGFFVFNREIFDYLSDDDSCCLERAPLERLARHGELRAFKYDGFWRCVDTLEDRDNLERMLSGRLVARVEPDAGRNPLPVGGTA
jgi:glucose-1-phosphate cytidylyltransferase